MRSPNKLQYNKNVFVNANKIIIHSPSLKQNLIPLLSEETLWPFSTFATSRSFAWFEHTFAVGIKFSLLFEIIGWEEWMA